MQELSSLGIDVGSTTVKIAAVDPAGRLAWHHLEPAEPRVEEQVSRFLELACLAGAAGDIPLVATGYGRGLVRQAGRKVTEITCHARGVFRDFPQGGTLIDIGGQDSKVILISPKGEVIDFVMSDKCAAGTGRFLENTAQRLRVPLAEMGPLALSAREEARITNTCTVFAESEVISLIAHGTQLDAILRGLHRALVERVAAMVRSVGSRPPLMLSGGVAWNPAVCEMLSEACGTTVIVPQHPQLTGAYGAGLIAAGWTA